MEIIASGDIFKVFVTIYLVPECQSLNQLFGWSSCGQLASLLVNGELNTGHYDDLLPV
jgi:hypothetical protein